MDITQIAAQFRKALQLIANSLDEESAMQVSTIFNPWDGNSRDYAVGEYCTFGLNSVGDPQLYVCLKSHASQADWKPDSASSLFKPVGVGENGIAEWSQPVGDVDAYHIGDVVICDGKKWECTLADANGNNIWRPGVYGWEVIA